MSRTVPRDVATRSSGERSAVIAPDGDARDGQGTSTYLADNVTVFFSRSDARAPGVLLPGDADAIP